MTKKTKIQIEGNDVIQIFVNDENAISEAPAEASLAVDSETFDFATVNEGEFSTAQALTVTGTNLENNISVSVTGDFEISISSESGFGSELTLDLNQAGDYIGDVYVRFAPSSPGEKTGTINTTSGDFTKSVSLIGVGEEVVTSNDHKMLQGVSYYPNPAFDVLRIDLTTEESFEYEIVSMQGAVLLEGIGLGETEIQVKNLETGVYILNVKQGKKQFNSRIIKR